MGFWKDVKKEWMVPVKGTPREKEQFWVDMASLIPAQYAFHANGGDLPWYWQFALFFAIVIAFDVVYYIAKGIIKKLTK